MSDDNLSRDIQFQGFAKLLFNEIYSTLDAFDGPDGDIPDGCAMCWYSNERLIEILGPLIARRAYDLACHVVTYLDEDVVWRKGKGYTASQIVKNDVPDMTGWAKEDANG